MATLHEANALSAFAQVTRPGVVPSKKKKPKKSLAAKVTEALLRSPAMREATSRRLREYYMPVAPAGSWEKTFELVQRAAQRAPAFGGNDGESYTWCISIIASYPEKSAVVISNTNTGELWAATYAVDEADLVTFPTVVKAEQTFKKVESGGGNVLPFRESARTTPLKESVSFHARIREVQVDDDGQGARAVCVMLAEGWGNSADGHYYTAECILDAAASGVFEGAQSYADHMDTIQERTRPERSTRDLIGWWSDVHAEESDGKHYLIGTFNIESGNAFALNKMREAKKYAERYKDDPSKQYVGFSIYAGGQSTQQEIDGKTGRAVSKITEAGSTDMVTRAGAGGKMLSLKEVQHMAKAAAITPEREKKFLESLVSGVSEQLAKRLGKTVKETARANRPRLTIVPKAVVLTESAFNAALEEAGVEMDDDDKGKMHAALAKALSPKKKGEEDASVPAGGDVDEEDDMALEAGSTGDPSLDDILDGDGDDDDDDEVDGDDEGGSDEDEPGKVKESDLPLSVRKRLKEAEALKAREALRDRAVLAQKIVREKSVPKAAQRYLVGELVECKTEKAMRAKADALIEAFVRPIHGDGVVGLPASSRVRESAGGSLISVSGIEK